MRCICIKKYIVGLGCTYMIHTTTSFFNDLVIYGLTLLHTSKEALLLQ